MEKSTQLHPVVVMAGILTIVLLVALPLLVRQESNFAGSDTLGTELVQRLAPSYDATWITNPWTPPGSETESMLFALQAAVGGGMIGYCFGFLRGRRSRSVPQKSSAGDA